MTLEEKIKLILQLIDEDLESSTIDTEFLIQLLELNPNPYAIAVELCIKKANIPDIKLGDVEIKTNQKYWYSLAQRYRNLDIDDKGNTIKRKGAGRVVLRYDEQR